MRQKKSRFQTRLDEIVAQRKKEETHSTEEATAPKVKLHEELTRRQRTRASQMAQNQTCGDWISMDEEIPPYYTPIDIKVAGEIMEDYHRVSDGEMECYCNTRDSLVAIGPTHWRKRPGIKYIPYEPMTEDDIKEFTRRDIKKIVEALTKLIDRRIHSNLPHIEYVAGVDDAIITVETLLNPKRMTGVKKV